MPTWERAEQKGRHRELRLEAKPFRWSELDSAQRSALVSLATMLAGAIDRLPDEPGTRRSARPPGLRLPLETERFNRTIFLSGSRGTGKTSVLLTLMNECASEARARPARAAEGRGDAAEEQPDAATASLLRLLSSNVVWLETLDMEPLPSSTNFLAAILARVEKAVDRSLVGSARAASRAHQHDVWSALRRLQLDVALAWEGNARERAAALDPDMFAVEVNRAEGVRLDLNAHLSSVLEQLAAELRDGMGIPKPIFVLPVDDFDLNPARCLDLLRLARLISCPRLFLIVLGDVRVAEQVFSLRLAGDYWEVAGRRVEPEILPFPPQRIAASVREISANAMRKLVPPQQRVLLGPMSPLEALRYRPPQADVTLGDILSRVPIEIKSADLVEGPDGRPSQRVAGRPLDTLGDLLTFTLTDASTPKGPRLLYEGTRALEAPPRHIADLWFLVHDLVQGGSALGQAGPHAQGQDTALEVMASETLTAVRESSLPPDIAAQVEGSLRKGPDEGWELTTSSFEFAMARLGTRSLMIRPGHTSPVITFAKAGGEFTGLCREATSQPRRLTSLRDPLVGRVGALVFLLHDLMTFSSSPYLVGQNLTPNVTKWSTTVWSAPEGRRVEIPWLTPFWDSFFEFTIFRAYWNHSIAMLPRTLPETQQAHCIAYAWIEAMTSVMDGQHVPFPAERLPEPGHWEALAGRIAALQKPGLTPARQEDVLGLVRSIACLLSPECSLPPDVAQALLPHLASTLQDPAVILRVKETRRVHLHGLVSNGLEDEAWYFAQNEVPPGPDDEGPEQVADQEPTWIEPIQRALALFPKEHGAATVRVLSESPPEALDRLGRALQGYSPKAAAGLLNLYSQLSPEERRQFTDNLRVPPVRRRGMRFFPKGGVMDAFAFTDDECEVLLTEGRAERRRRLRRERGEATGEEEPETRPK